MHVYGQQAWHDDVVIVGSSADMIALRDQIDAAIHCIKVKDTPDYFTNDGEGYGIIIIPVTEQEMQEIPLPYTDDSIGAADHDRGRWDKLLALEREIMR